MALLGLGAAALVVSSVRAPAPVPASSKPRASAAPHDAGSRDAGKLETEACLRRELPQDFGPSKSSLVNAAVEKCLGRTPQAVWAKGVRKFRFGRDTRTGLAVELLVTCEDLCPQDAYAAVVYADAPTETQCLCQGARPLIGMGWGDYLGCAPARRPKRRLRYSIMPVPGKKQFRVMGGVFGTRLIQLGISQGDTLLTVDGKPIRTAAEADKAMQRFPDDPPRQVQLQGSVYKAEIHYVDWDTVKRLSQQLMALRKQAPRPTFCSASRGHAITLYPYPVIGKRCHDAATKAWLRFIRRVEATRSAPGQRRGLDHFPGCSALRGTQTSFSVLDGRDEFEVKYVGWLALAPGKAR